MGINDGIKAVIFDVGNTLLTERDNDWNKTDVKDIQFYLKEHFKADYSADHIRSSVKTGLKEYKDYGILTDQELPANLILTKFVFKDLVVSKESEEAARELLLKIDIKKAPFELGPQTKQVLSELKNRGYRLGVISNTLTDRAKITLRQFDLAEYFDEAVYSNEVGVRKPNPLIFQELLKLMRLKPEEAAYVGDNFARDVVGSSRAGFGQSIWLSGGQTLTKVDLQKMTRKFDTIKRFDELLAFFPKKITAPDKEALMNAERSTPKRIKV